MPAVPLINKPEKPTKDDNKKSSDMDMSVKKGKLRNNIGRCPIRNKKE